MSAPSNPTPFARPTFPHLQASSSSQSSSYFSSTSSIASSSPASSAPLPSPSSTQPQHQGFFGSLNHQSQQSQPQRQPVQRHSSFEYQPNRDGAGATASETTNYLNQAALLAEAAKRAQMAVVMRDIEGMEL